MKLNILLKLFVIMFIMFFLSDISFAQEFNNISKIYVEKSDSKNYNLNLFFKDKFTGNAFVQRKDRGSYYVYLPDTHLKSKNIKVSYQDKKDKDIVKITNISDRKSQEKSSNSNYAKFLVEISPTYSIHLIAKTTNSQNPFAAIFIFLVKTIAVFLLLISLVVGILKTVKNIKVKKPKVDLFEKFTDVSIQQKKQPVEIQEPLKVQKTNAEDYTVTRPIRSKSKGLFSCFDVQARNEVKAPDIEMKSNITRTAALQKDKANQIKQTNPVNKNQYGDSGLAIPEVQDLEKIKEQENKYKNAPVLLSELRITPNKGFYLTSTENSFSLFGFVGERIFLLKKFQDLSQLNLQARYYDTKNNKDLYIVRLDSYKSIVEISESGLKELAAL